ncbi:MAG: hypothetical protein UV73_C0005G0023 [Candidatus Gottesmanbacteria bacterium GW2011_GWA2_43_14]|uniref:Uncharacterized protein n=1 Tax=Candidatus Gottesmanbacteria bacterium GW2011_GWA2_43_14 TaxID=1618443 RepID=A0A0G1FRU5_9BACT|nr:MAG: hypothetical protein UV73_C0005G0023 [Candidatus Gottesmanbacteria bacterium GW2011_GWA2_43_14]
MPNPEQSRIASYGRNLTEISQFIRQAGQSAREKAAAIKNYLSESFPKIQFGSLIVLYLLGGNYEGEAIKKAEAIPYQPQTMDLSETDLTSFDFAIAAIAKEATGNTTLNLLGIKDGKIEFRKNLLTNSSESGRPDVLNKLAVNPETGKMAVIGQDDLGQTDLWAVSISGLVERLTNDTRIEKFITRSRIHPGSFYVIYSNSDEIGIINSLGENTGSLSVTGESVDDYLSNFVYSDSLQSIFWRDTTLMNEEYLGMGTEPKFGCRFDCIFFVNDSLIWVIPEYTPNPEGDPDKNKSYPVAPGEQITPFNGVNQEEAQGVINRNGILFLRNRDGTENQLTDDFETFTDIGLIENPLETHTVFLPLLNQNPKGADHP